MLFVGRAISGVIEEDRTLDLQSHNLAFCQLNYDHHKKVVGAPGRIRTFDLCLRRALLYPAELWKQMEQVKGIGPSQPAWKASVLPLNYTCKCSSSLPCTAKIVKKKSKNNLKHFKFLNRKTFQNNNLLNLTAYVTINSSKSWRKK